MLRVDGTPVIVEGRGVKTSIDGKPAIQVAIRDITERKLVEEILQKSEKQYRSLVETTGTGYVILDKAGRVITANQEYVRLTGRSTLAEIEKRSVTDWTAPYDLERNTREIEQCFRIGQVRGLGVDYQRPDGTIQSIEINASVIQSDSEQIILTLCRDITERKRAEEALRESEATARALLNAPTDSVILIDCEGKILALNEIAASRFGKRSDELVGIMSYDILPKEVAQLRRSLMAPVLEKREMVRFVDQRDGRWYDTVAYPIVNESGNVKKIAIIARDVTEQKNIEKQLRKSEQIYKRLLEQSFDAIAIHKQGKITFLNERAAKVLGAAKPEDLIGRPIFDFIHPESRKDLEDRLKELSATEGMSAPLITEKFIRTDGSTVTVEVMAISFDDNGIPASRVAFREISTP
jgi:PAS domain S-box-containing protein